MAFAQSTVAAAAEKLADDLNLASVTGCAAPVDDACAETYLERLAKRAFRGAFGTAERDQLFGLYRSSKVDFADAETALRQMHPAAIILDIALGPENAWDLLVRLGAFTGVVLLALGAQMFIVYPLLLKIFAGVRDFPVRVKCATLPWHAFEAALKSGLTGDTVKTE